MHLRCRSCHQYLAGPLTQKRPGCRPEIEFNEFLLFGDVDFSLHPSLGLCPEGDEDILLHPQWYDGWRSEWPDRADGASKRTMFISATGSFGCCGPTGDATCKCSAKLGRIWADCIGQQLMLLYHRRVERSDKTQDCIWTFLSDAEDSNDWIESFGELRDGNRHGEWECWLNHVTHDLVDARNKERKSIIKQKSTVTRSLVRLETWENGVLVESANGNVV